MADSGEKKKFASSVAYIYSSFPGYVKCTKTLNLLVDNFSEVHYIGCSRSNTTDTHRPEGVEYHIAEINMGYGLDSFKKLPAFFKYMKEVLAEINVDVVILVNDELMLPFLINYIPRPKHLIIDLYDSISMRIKHLKPFVTRVLRAYTQWAVSGCDAFAEVSPERLSTHNRKPANYSVIYNSPKVIDDVNAKEGLPEDFIFVNGYLADNDFGAETLLPALENTPGLKIVYAGRASGDFIDNKFLKHPDVINLGEIPHHDVFPVAMASRAIFYHVKPVSLIYIYSAANKLMEAMMLGKPVLVNGENLALKSFGDLGFLLPSAYGDEIGLQKNLEMLVGGNEELEKSCLKAKKAFREKYSWEIMEKRWIDMLVDMGVK